MFLYGYQKNYSPNFYDSLGTWRHYSTEYLGYAVVGTSTQDYVIGYRPLQVKLRFLCYAPRALTLIKVHILVNVYSGNSYTAVLGMPDQ